MGKKKAFIDKSKATTFKLVPTAEYQEKKVGHPEIVNVVDVTEEEIAEREKYGIFYNDNYNYMSHLKSKDETIPVEFEKTNIDLPKSAVRLADNIAIINGKEVNLNTPRERRPTSGHLVDVEPNIDTDVLALLDAGEGEDNIADDAELEDDFFALAGGMENPDEIRRFAQFRDRDESEDEEDDLRYDNLEDPFEESDNEARGPVSTNPDKAAYDERFNEFFNAVDEDEDDEDDDEPVDDQLLNTLADEYAEEQDKVMFEKPDELSKELSLKAYERQENETEETEVIEVPTRSKKARWDCETIVSTYSNQYNHPTIIREPSKRKVAGLTKRDLKELASEDMECDVVSMRSGRSACTIRVRGETTEERRERKRAVKEERRERRIEKKANKEAFKDEKKKMDAQRRNPTVNGRPIN